MRIPRLSVRHRVLAVCFLISLAAVAALTAGGIAFRRVLRSRARESCTRMAAVFESFAHNRLICLIAEATALAGSARQGAGAEARPEGDEWMSGWMDDCQTVRHPSNHPSVQSSPAASALAGSPESAPVICTWSLYDAAGHRMGHRCPPPPGADLQDLGIGTPTIPARERFRVSEAIEGRPSTVLVPGGERLYAVNYQPVPRTGQAVAGARGEPGGSPQAAVLQVATEMSESIFPLPRHAGGARAVLRPYTAATAEARLVSVDGEPRLLVSQPFICGGRPLGAVVAAVPYGAEARCERAVLIGIVVAVSLALAVLTVVSCVLTRVAMVPLERVRYFMTRLQDGFEIEHATDVVDDEAGALLHAYQRMLARSQDWADRIVEFSRAQQDLLRGAMEALVSAIEAKDQYTAGHSKRVADTACAVAIELQWEGPAVEQLRLGAILHDIGKIGIHLHVLNKPDTLDAEETEAVRQHPTIGARILSSIPGCEDVVRAVLYHHERYDGKGYPTGVAAEAIPPAARIIAIADVYDALTSKRSYRPAFPAEEAIRILRESRGTMFDPQLLDIFLGVICRRRGLAAPESDLPAAGADEGTDGSNQLPLTDTAEAHL